MRATSPTRSPERNISDTSMALRSPSDVRLSKVATRAVYSSAVAAWVSVHCGAHGWATSRIGERRPSSGSVVWRSQAL